MKKNTKVNDNATSEIKKEIVQHIAVLRKGTGKNGFNKEINIVSWNGREPRYDIRSWSSDYMSCRKDVTFTEEEMRILLVALQKHFANK